jgi:hypothetical protein
MKKEERIRGRTHKNQNSQYTELLFLIQEWLDILKFTQSFSQCRHLASALGYKLGQPLQDAKHNLMLHLLRPGPKDT